MHQTHSDDAGQEVVAPHAAPPRKQRKGRRHGRWVMDYTPDEVNGVLRDYDAGLNAEEIGEKHGISKSTLYRWIARYEDQRNVNADPSSLRMRIATLEKAVLHLSLENAALRAAREDEGKSEVSETLPAPTPEPEHVAS